MIVQLHHGMLLLMIGLLLPVQVEPIIGGANAKPGEFPHQALLGYPTSEQDVHDFNCGGALISNRYVLTAAHCVSTKLPDIVLLGEHDLKADSDNQVKVQIESIIKHPDYLNRVAYNDIALVKLKQDIATSRWIQPACLWKDARNVSSVIATGFGLTEFQGSPSDVLQKVELDVFDTNVCSATYGTNRKFPTGVLDSQLCIGSDNDGEDTCQGDAGGPVQIATTGSEECSYYVVGITSLGIHCGFSKYKSISTRVSSYVEWIEATIKT